MHAVANEEEERGEEEEVCHSSDAMRVGDKRLTPFERTMESDRCYYVSRFRFNDSNVFLCSERNLVKFLFLSFFF